MSWDAALGLLDILVVGMLVPYIIYLESRIMKISTDLSKKLDREEVKELVDLKQEAVITKIDNLKEDIQELKEQLKHIADKL